MKLKPGFLSLPVVILALASCGSFQRAVKPFTVDLDGPRYAAGAADAQFDKVLGAIKKDGIAVYYYPDDDAACLEFRAEWVYYSQFWSRGGREAFVNALEQYKADYEGRSLAAKSRKTKKAYGSVQGYLAWSTMRILSEPARGNSDLELGYTFKEKAPFFCVMQRSAVYKDAESRVSESPNMTMYFTRAQAEAVAALFDQRHLEDTVNSAASKPSEGLKDILRNVFNVR